MTRHTPTTPTDSRPSVDFEAAGIDVVGTARERRGIEEPHELAADVPLVERAFAFVDLCGFTAFTAQEGEHAAIDALGTFRWLCREVATRRGVRVAKWLGDGAMLVGVDVTSTIATTVELVGRQASQRLALRGGVAHGWVLLFEGDDYIGRPTNLAARLCQVAEGGETLAVGYAAEALPHWIQVAGTRDLTLPGLGSILDVQCLTLTEDTALPELR